MKLSITKGLTKDVADEVASSFNAGILFRRRLITLLEEKIDYIRKSSNTMEKYDSPNWALLQADANGYERAQRELISLLSEK